MPTSYMLITAIDNTSVHKGHVAYAAAIVQAMREGHEAPISFIEITELIRINIEIVEYLI